MIHLNRIVPRRFFELESNRSVINKNASHHNKADDPFILTGKIFCGHCGTPMTGTSISGTGISSHHYIYSNNKRVKRCQQNSVRKQTIEDIVIKSIAALLLNDDMLHEMADMITEKQAISFAEIRTQSELFSAGISPSDLLRRRYEALPDATIRIEPLDTQELSSSEVLCWLEHIRTTDLSDTKTRRMLVDCFLSAVYIFDDHYVIVNNLSKTTSTIELTEVTASSIPNLFFSPERRIITPIMRRSPPFICNFIYIS